MLLLTSPILLPLVFAVLVFLSRNHAFHSYLATLGGAVSLAAIGRLFLYFQSLDAPLLLGSLFGASLWLDGLSLLFMASTALIVLLLLLHSLCRPVESRHLLSIGLLLVEATMMGLFLSHNLLVFITLLLIQTLLVGYMMWRWSGSSEKDAALKRYYQFMGLSLILLLAGAIMAAWASNATGNSLSFELSHLQAQPLSQAAQGLVFFALFYGFAIRIPVFPFHGWLTTTVHQGNIVVGPALLLGVKVGIYGLLRFVLNLSPNAAQKWGPYLVALSIFGVFYAAILAMQQNNIRRLAAYAVLSHTSIIVVGIFTLHPLALQGSVMLTVTYGLAITALFIALGHIHSRKQTAQLDQLGGLWAALPYSGLLFGVASLALIGMPGTPGFDAIHLLLEGGMIQFGALVTVFMALGNVIVAAFLLRAFQRIFLGETKPSSKVASKNTPLEICVVLLMVFTLLAFGFFVEPWLQMLATPLDQLSQGFNQVGH